MASFMGTMGATRRERADIRVFRVQPWPSRMRARVRDVPIHKETRGSRACRAVKGAAVGRETEEAQVLGLLEERVLPEAGGRAQGVPTEILGVLQDA